MDLRHHTYRNACEIDQKVRVCTNNHLQLELHMLRLYLVLLDGFCIVLILRLSTRLSTPCRLLVLNTCTPSFRGLEWCAC